ncbi:MAG: ComF family protein [Lachnospiraceae bacterium]|nr:ComF family protein [Lachnospiraceae bacterium]
MKTGIRKTGKKEGPGKLLLVDPAGLLFPRRCPVCQEVVEEKGERICGICRTRLPYIRGPVCLKCGKPLLSEEREYCKDCGRKRRWTDCGRASFLYDEVMRRSIAGYKYGGRREYAAFYAGEILKRCAGEMKGWKGEVFVPIPLHASRKRKRGFNQAELLSKELSKRSGIPTDAGLLKRVKKTHVQKELNDQERLTNLKDAFSVRKGKVPCQNIILVDDIYTTGSTMDAAAKILKKHGAKKVYFICICVGEGN